MDGPGKNVRQGLIVSLAFILIAVVSCIAVIRNHQESSSILAEFHGDDVQSEIENDSASHLLIQKDVKLALKISGEAEKIYIRADSTKKKYETEIEQEQSLVRTASGELKKASELRNESQSMVHQSQKMLDEFTKQEGWAEQEQLRAQAAAAEYRHDVMRLAGEVSEIASLKQQGKPVPAKLSAEMKNITHQMAIDSKRSKEEFHNLAHRAKTYDITGDDKNPATLQIPATSWSLNHEAKQESARAIESIQKAKAKIAALQEKEAKLKKPFADAECLEKMAERYRFDDETVRDAHKAYLQAINECSKA